MAGEIFISYRRSRDSEAAKLERALSEHGFAQHQIFRDVRGLFAGESFDTQINETLQRAKVVLLLVGAGDAPRAESDDWVAKELRAALQSTRPIIPVALGASGVQETAKEWPDEFRTIVATQFTIVRDESFDDDIRRLVGVLARKGCRPQRVADSWNSLLDHLDLSDPIDRMLAPLRERRSGVVVLRGRHGTGRSCVMRTVRDRLRDADARRVGTHLALDNRVMGVDGAAVYDWLDGLWDDHAQGDDAAFDLVHAGLDPTHLSRHLVDRLGPDQRCRLNTQSTAGVPSSLTAIATVLVDRLAAVSPVVITVDDVDFADAGSQEVVRMIARRLHEPDPPDVHLVVSTARSGLSDLYFASLRPHVTVDLEPDVEEMFGRSDLFTPEATEQLTRLGLPPGDYANYLEHLHAADLLVQRDGSWDITTTSLPLMGDVLDRVVSELFPASLQLVLEAAAVVGPRFDVDHMGRFAGIPDLGRRLVAYDPDHEVIKECAVRGHLAFSSATWWDHLRRRWLADADRLVDNGDLVRLAASLRGSLEGAVAPTSDQWAAVGVLHDLVEDHAAAGSCFLRAASAARSSGFREVAAQSYRQAAERFELTAVRSPELIEQAAQLLRTSFCLYRAATVEQHTPPEPGAAVTGLARSARPDRVSDLAQLEQIDVLLRAIGERLERAKQGVRPVDFDEIVTKGTDMNVERLAELRNQWRTMSGFVAIERGRCHLALEDKTEAVRCFTQALMLGEIGLSGSAYHDLIVAASAGLAWAFSCSPDLTIGDARAQSAVEHGARAAMLIGFSPYGGGGTHRDRDRFGEARKWIDASREQLSTSLAIANLSTHTALDRPIGEQQLIDFVIGTSRLVSLAERAGHADSIEHRTREIVMSAVDLTDVRDDPTFLFDLRLFAHAHDQFRFADPARMLRMWRDIGKADSESGRPGAEEEWLNPTLLHGPIAALWLERDLQVAKVIGVGRAQRVVAAVASHTVGLAELDQHRHAAFVMTAQLGDLWSRSSSVGRHHDWSRWLEQPGGLRRVYLAAHAARRRQLELEGRPVSAVTISLLEGVDEFADPAPGAVVSTVEQLATGNPSP